MNAITRRRFLQSAAVTAAVVQFPHRLSGAEEKQLKLGLIGSGGYGMADARAAIKAGGAEIAAICDVDSEHLSRSAAELEKLQGKAPHSFKRHEDLLEVEGLDAVIIATPPQWHALQFIAALDRGLHVYCEKPLSYDVREGRAMLDAAKKSRQIVQVGFQRRQSAAFQAVRQRIAAGDAGRIICADANIHYSAGTKDSTPQPPPASLDWDLWCGPAPMIPYSPQVGHVNWRLEKTTGHGHLVDWGIHLIDAFRVIMGEGMPKTVTAAGGIYALQGKITTPDVLTAHFEYSKCPLTWRHRIWGAQEYMPATSNGIFFFGEKETLFVTDDRWEVIPRRKGEQRQVKAVQSDAGLLHMAEFLKAIRTGQQPGCGVEDAYGSTASVQLAMIAYETGAKVTWDAGKEELITPASGAGLLKREYRAPWQHPYRG